MKKNLFHVIYFFLIVPQLLSAQVTDGEFDNVTIENELVARKGTTLHNLNVLGNSHVNISFSQETTTSSLDVLGNASVSSLDVLTDAVIGCNLDVGCTLTASALEILVDQDITCNLNVGCLLTTSALEVLTNALIGGSTTTSSLDVLTNETVGGNLNVAGTVSSCDVVVGCNLFLNDTLNPSIGNVIKNGNRFIHTAPGSASASTFVGENSGNFAADPTAVNNTTLGANTLSTIAFGQLNTAVGSSALQSLNGSNVGGSVGNTAVGAFALQNTSGFTTAEGNFNTAVGLNSLNQNTTGIFNSGLGSNSLVANTNGNGNVAVGTNALLSNTAGSLNVAVGTSALLSNTVGTLNVAMGFNAGLNVTGDNNILIGAVSTLPVHLPAGSSSNTVIGGGAQARTFINGIRGVTTDFNDAIPVLIDSVGQLGTLSSSKRFKQNIEDIGNHSDLLMQLRPVIFNYITDESNQRNYGFIAEEVAQIYPELVIFDEDGKPYTVKYHLLYALLLNEIQKNHHAIKTILERLNILEAMSINK